MLIELFVSRCWYSCIFVWYCTKYSSLFALQLNPQETSRSAVLWTTPWSQVSALLLPATYSSSVFCWPLLIAILSTRCLVQCERVWAGAAWHLSSSKHVKVTVLEAEQRAGGHAHTLDLNLDGQTVPVDTGCVTVENLFFFMFTNTSAVTHIVLYPRLRPSSPDTVDLIYPLSFYFLPSNTV